MVGKITVIDAKAYPIVAGFFQKEKESNVVILIGAESCTGKTLMAQQLLEKYSIPYFSLDHLKMGLFLSDTNCEFKPEDDNDVIEEKLWPIVKSMIKVVLENGQNIIIEGCYLYPQRLATFSEQERANMISVFMGFSRDYIQNNFISCILKYKGIFEKRESTEERTADWFVKAHGKLKQMCLDSDERYFEIHSDYKAELEKIYQWVDEEVLRIGISPK